MRFGFTGSQSGFPEEKILEVLKSLDLKKGDVVFTGGCIGVDSQIAQLVNKHFPEVKQVIVVPYVQHLPKYNQNKLDKKAMSLGIVFQLPFKEEYNSHPFLCYRDRNQKIVDFSDQIIAFKKGNKPRSGTQMTINMAKKAEKLHSIHRED